MATPNRVLFDAFTAATGTELWISDGTTAGTSLLKDIQAGTGSSSAYKFTQLGNRVVFNAYDSVHGVELWVTDGTTAGTTLLRDILPGNKSGLTYNVASPGVRPAGGKLVFPASDGVVGAELWVTDGTTAGTALLKDIYPGATGSRIGYFGAFGTKQLFQAFDGVHTTAGDGKHGLSLWITDGTTAGTQPIFNLANNVYGSIGPKFFTDLGTGKAVFSAAYGSASRELWVTDGTGAGTSLLKDIHTGFYAPSNPGPATLVGTTGKAVFAAIGNSYNSSAGKGTELWVTDGTTTGTSLLKTFSEGYTRGGFAFTSYGANGRFTTLGSKVLFAGSDGGTTGLWATDGTAAGTVKISGATDFKSDFPYNFTPFGTKDLFWAGTGLGASPWVTDGTAAGTYQLKQLNTQTTQGNLQRFGVAGGRAMFRATGATPGSTVDLWVTNGTRAGTYDLGVSALTNPSDFATFGNKVVFQGKDATHGVEAWITDGFFSGTTLLKDVNTNNNFSFAPYGSSTPTGFFAAALACFAAGTRLRTPGGETPVEALRRGDLVLTASGEARPVVWIGHRRVDVARHPDPASVAPVRIAPHAFGPNQPAAPLFLSPDHAICAEGVLIPVRCLIDGNSVAPVAAREVVYYHVELPDHDVLLAEGLPVESYLDTGDRDGFADGATVRLFPGPFGAGRATAAWEARGCAPLRVVGPEVETVRARLARRLLARAA